VCTCHSLHLPPYLRQPRVLRCTTQFVTALAHVPITPPAPLPVVLAAFRYITPRSLPGSMLQHGTFHKRFGTLPSHLFQDAPASHPYTHRSPGSIPLHSAVLHANRLPEHYKIHCFVRRS
jgi:hypothetical protein